MGAFPYEMQIRAFDREPAGLAGEPCTDRVRARRGISVCSRSQNELVKVACQGPSVSFSIPCPPSFPLHKGPPELICGSPHCPGTSVPQTPKRWILGLGISLPRILPRFGPKEGSLGWRPGGMLPERGPAVPAFAAQPSRSFSSSQGLWVSASYPHRVWLFKRFGFGPPLRSQSRRGLGLTMVFF